MIFRYCDPLRFKKVELVVVWEYKMPDKQYFVVICIFLAGVCCISVAIGCIPAAGYEGCACYTVKNNTKEYVNLLPLKINSSSPRFTVMDSKSWYISYSPCGVFNEFVGENNTGYKPCVKASVARWTNLSTHRCESLGNEEQANFESTTVGDNDGNIISNLTLVFTSSEHHSAKISLVCNDTLAENETSFKYINTTNVPTNTYYLALTSKCCCPGKCGSPPALPPTTSPTDNTPASSSSGPLKTWEIIVIVAASVVLVLFIIAMVYCCKRSRGYQPV